MPRDGTGQYNLPSTSVVSGAPISAADENLTRSDIAVALTGSLARDGSGGMTGPLNMGGNAILNGGAITGGAITGDAITGGAFSGTVYTLRIPDGAWSAAALEAQGTGGVALGGVTVQRLNTGPQSRVLVNLRDSATTTATPLTIQHDGITATVPVSVPTPTAAGHAAHKDYVDAATATKLNVANPIATGSLTVTASSGNTNLTLARSGVRTWSIYVDGTNGVWGLFDNTANASRLWVDTGGVLNTGAVNAAFVRTTGQVRALGGISFAESGSLSSAMSFGWTAESAPSTYLWVNGTGIGKLPHSPNVSSFRSTGDGTSPYLEYIDLGGGAFGARSFVSDERMKENIRPVTEPFLPRVRALRPKSFDWRAEVSEGWSSRHNPLGLIAQEVAAAIPSAASLIGEGEKARYHLDPLTLIAALIGAVNELAASNEAQSALIASLHARLGASAGEVTKLAVVDRLTAAGAMPALSAMLDADPPLAAWWQAALVFRVDDPAIIDLVAQIGEDPAVILAPVPAPITRRQLRLWLLRKGKTDADVRAVIAAIPDPTQRAAALIEWEDATTYERGHPLIASLGAALGFTAEQMDAGFREAAAL